MPFGVYRAMAGYGLDKNEPVLLDMMDNRIGHLAMSFNLYAQVQQSGLVEVGPLLLSIPHIDDVASRREERTEIAYL